MKKIVVFFSVLLMCVCVYGQAYEGTVQFDKQAQPAAIIELPYPPSVVNDAMNSYLSKKGKSRSNDIKGFTTFRNMQPVPTDSTNADLYFKTERKSRKEKEITLVSLLVMPNDAQAASANLHYLTMEDAKAYLEGLATTVNAYNLELTIKDQNDAVIKAEAKYKNMVNQGEDLVNKRAAIDKKILENKNDQEKQSKEVDSQRQKLSEWVSQRKS